MVKKKTSEKEDENLYEEIKDMPVKTRVYLDDMKEKYSEKIQEYSDKAKQQIEEKPYLSVGTAAGVGAIVGLGLGVGLYAMSNSCNDKYNYRKFKKGSLNYKDKFDSEFKENPYESLAIATGIGVLIGTGIKALFKKEK